MKITVKGVEALETTAAQLISFAGNTRFFIFEGDMGAGKTTFIKAICKQMDVTDVVSSPTFSIVNEYAGSEGPVYHFDFYRLKNLQEAYDIGYEEYFYSGATCLVEWPEKIDGLLPDEYIKITITALSETEREMIFEQHGAHV